MRTDFDRSAGARRFQNRGSEIEHGEGAIRGSEVVGIVDQDVQKAGHGIGILPGNRQRFPAVTARDPKFSVAKKQVGFLAVDRQQFAELARIADEIHR